MAADVVIGDINVSHQDLAGLVRNIPIKHVSAILQHTVRVGVGFLGQFDNIAPVDVETEHPRVADRSPRGGIDCTGLADQARSRGPAAPG